MGGSRKYTPPPKILQTTATFEAVEKKFGDPIPRVKGDWKIIDKHIMADKKIVKRQINEITTEVSRLTGQQRTDYLDQKWIDNENKIMDLRRQYDLYGKKTVQGRLIDQHIKGRVHIQNHIERQAGFRRPYDAPNLKGNNPQPQADPKKFVRGYDAFGQPYSGGRRYNKDGTPKRSDKNYNERKDFWDN